MTHHAPNVVLILISLALPGALGAHGNGHTEDAKASVRYITHIKPVFDSLCAVCHGPDSPEHKAFALDQQKYISLGKGPRMDTYTHLVSFIAWPDTGAVMRRLDDGKNAAGRKPGNMYVHLGADEAERQRNLSLFKEWIGHWTLKRRAEISTGELEKIKIPY